MTALVDIAGLDVAFPLRRSLFARPRLLRAVAGVDLAIGRGEVVGLVGESGSGKTTLARAVMRLVEPTAGQIRFDGIDITHRDRAAMRALRRRMQMIFQDPYSSLNPRLRVRDIIGEAYAIHGIGTPRDRRERAEAMLARVGLPADALDRFPHEFSGGQRQRIGIARALATGAEFVVADEPVSALDVSVQAQVLNLLQDLQQSLGLAMLFIAHDLGVVQHISDRIVVLYLGRVMEVAPSDVLYTQPRHPYTAALLGATPARLRGEIPSPLSPPSGCVFRTRCPYAIAPCASVVPRLIEVTPGHAKACIRDDVLRG